MPQVWERRVATASSVLLPRVSRKRRPRKQRPRKRRPTEQNRGEWGALNRSVPHPRTKPKWHIHSKSQCNLIKRAKHPRKSLIAASYPGLVISNAKVNRSNMHVQHTFLHIVVRADDSLRTKIAWMHFGHFPFTQNLRNFGNSGNWYSIFPEKFPDFRKRFRLRTIQPEILDIREQI